MALPLVYHWRNLFVRRATTILTMLVVGAVVAALTWILGLAFALRGSLAVAHDEGKLIVLRRGSNSEALSALPVPDYNLLTQVNHVERDPGTNTPLVSPEMLVQVSLPRLRDGGKTNANVAVRGVTEMAFKVHRSVQLQGSLFSTGGQEVIVGTKAAQQFAGLALGDTIDLGFGNNRAYQVVGYFTAEGGPLESEIWGYLPSIMNAYNRSAYSCASLRVAPGTDPATVVAQIGGPAIQLDAKTEADYWRGQSSRILGYIAIVSGLVLVMAVAAVCSIANTMFAAVAGRTREIAMLRTIGFRPRHILTGFVGEAVLLALLGGVLGCAACGAWLEIAGHTKDIYGATTFTTMAFDIRLTPLIVVVSLGVVAAVGAVGAFVPAWRASRVEVITALREA